MKKNQKTGIVDRLKQTVGKVGKTMRSQNTSKSDGQKTSGKTKRPKKSAKTSRTVPVHKKNLFSRIGVILKKHLSKLNKRQKMLFGGMGGAIVAALVVILIIAATRGGTSGDFSSDPEVTAEESAAVSDMEQAADSVCHLSFPILLADENMLTEGDTRLTVSQFNEILQNLYDSGYVLVDFYDIAEQVQQEDGTISYTASTLSLPEGKKPLIISQRDVSYPLSGVGAGYASGLVLDAAGDIKNSYQLGDGTITTGNFDVIPVLEAFIQVHPDFSVDNARAVIGLTGYNGILGYRTTAALGQEGNAYAGYGLFDTAAETTAAAAVVQKLQDLGYHFACNGYDLTSYGSEYSFVETDANAWQAEVSALVGGTDIMIFPRQTDIAGWSSYSTSNQKYALLQGLGFKYYCIEDTAQPAWLQLGTDYVRQGIWEINSLADYQQFMAAAAS